MKKLGKLEINSKKIIKNEELLTLRGGYDSINCCKCMDENTVIANMISYHENCDPDCHYTYGSEIHGVWFCS